MNNIHAKALHSFLSHRRLPSLEERFTHILSHPLLSLPSTSTLTLVRPAAVNNHHRRHGRSYNQKKPRPTGLKMPSLAYPTAKPPFLTNMLIQLTSIQSFPGRWIRFSITSTSGLLTVDTLAQVTSSTSKILLSWIFWGSMVVIPWDGYSRYPSCSSTKTRRKKRG